MTLLLPPPLPFCKQPSCKLPAKLSFLLVSPVGKALVYDGRWPRVVSLAVNSKAEPRGLRSQPRTCSSGRSYQVFRSSAKADAGNLLPQYPLGKHLLLGGALFEPFGLRSIAMPHFGVLTCGCLSIARTPRFQTPAWLGDLKGTTIFVQPENVSFDSRVSASAIRDPRTCRSGRVCRLCCFG